MPDEELGTVPTTPFERVPEDDGFEVVETVESEQEPKPEPTIQINNGDDMADMFKAPKIEDADMATADLFSVSEEDVMGIGGSDMSDLTEVTDEDMLGEDMGWGSEQPPPQPQPQRPRRTIRRVKRVRRPSTPPPMMGGLR